MEDQRKIWDYYQNVAPEVFQLSRPRLDALVKEVRNKVRARNARILGIGSGDGYFEETVAAAGFSIVSLDPDEGAVKRLKAKGIECHQGSIAELPFESSYFDAVVASEVLEHLDEDTRRRGVREVARVLKREGWFIGTVPYNETLDKYKVVCPRCGERFHRWGHLKSFTLPILRECLASQFDVVDVKLTAFVRFRGRSPMGKLKSLARILMAKCGISMASPAICFAASGAKTRR